MNETELFDKAMRLWGLEAQSMMLIEEMAELTKEVCKQGRGGSLRHFIEELADVDIMLGQFKRWLMNEGKIEEFNEVREVKLIRLNNKMREAGE